MTQMVASATLEQKKGGELVVVAMENVSDLARRNLAGVEQLNASASQLSAQAAELAAIVGEFRMA
ncbi:MAG TPA: hypothetical protein VNX25_05325 [Verrucomicrobiae bacterium]|nr:hypothetical protein [Verrucomicrobiae bacterium]